jgi:hypothetical protein
MSDWKPALGTRLGQIDLYYYNASTDSITVFEKSSVYESDDAAFRRPAPYSLHLAGPAVRQRSANRATRHNLKLRRLGVNVKQTSLARADGEVSF